ncbi:DUF1365 domain-containing protein [soil metagenome]
MGTGVGTEVSTEVSTGSRVGPSTRRDTAAAIGPHGLPSLPALVDGVVTHDRRVPLRHRFRYRMYQWLIDVDAPPRLPRWLHPFAAFDSADHLGSPRRTIRANLETFCAAAGVDVTGGRIVMLANARVLGHVFDPLSVFWCLDDAGAVRCVVAEVHNTYGERHAYLLDVDAAGRASTDKAFYVSPFFTVDGRYDLRFLLDRDRVATTIRLRQGDRSVFSAAFTGAVRPATPARLMSLLARRPFMTQRVSLLIRIHGSWLWLRRLPVVPRKAHRHQEGLR